MGIIGDRYIGTYKGHSIELVRDNVGKTLTLRIDGQNVASESRILPHNIRLTATFEHDGVLHNVVAQSVAHVISADDTVQVDGSPLTLTKTQ